MTNNQTNKKKLEDRLINFVVLIIEISESLWFNSERIGDSGYQATDIDLDAQVLNSGYDNWPENSRDGAASSVLRRL